MIDALPAIVGRDVPRETFEQLESFVALLLEANGQQNLIAASTVPEVWPRHILDSAQLVPLAGEGTWLDVGSGGGLPGVVTAILTGAPTLLIEPRRLRAEFLDSVRCALDLANVQVHRVRPAALTGAFDNITARAVAPAAELLRMTAHLARPGTRWLLPKGRTAHKELDEVRAAWQGSFRLEPSRTDPDASILIATDIRAWGTRARGPR